MKSRDLLQNSIGSKIHLGKISFPWNIFSRTPLANWWQMLQPRHFVSNRLVSPSSTPSFLPPRISFTLSAVLKGRGWSWGTSGAHWDVYLCRCVCAYCYLCMCAQEEVWGYGGTLGSAAAAACMECCVRGPSAYSVEEYFICFSPTVSESSSAAACVVVGETDPGRAVFRGKPRRRRPILRESLFGLRNQVLSS